MFELFYDDFSVNGAPQMPVMQFSETSSLHIYEQQPYSIKPLPRIAPNISVIFDTTGSSTGINLKSSGIIFAKENLHIHDGDDISSYNYSDMPLAGRTITPEDVVSFIDAYFYFLKPFTFAIMILINFFTLLITIAILAAFGGIMNAILSMKQPLQMTFSQLFKIAAMAVTAPILLEIPFEHYTGLTFPETLFFIGIMLFILYDLRKTLVSGAH